MKCYSKIDKHQYQVAFSVQSPFIQAGVARAPVSSRLPPNVHASFFSSPLYFSLRFSFTATVFSSTLLFTCENLIYFFDLISSSLTCCYSSFFFFMATIYTFLLTSFSSLSRILASTDGSILANDLLVAGACLLTDFLSSFHYSSNYLFLSSISFLLLFSSANLSCCS